LLERFSANLIRCRERANLSPAQLADYAEISRSDVCRLEQAAYLPGVEKVVRLAGALRVDPADLLAGMRWEARYGHFVEHWPLEWELACGDA
ncbi:MAG TPA: helix-turn-helix transcriptional regulator, partial [Solirubrobacterales bacterium]